MRSEKRAVWLAFLVGSLIVGAALRLLWIGDIEYKSDQVYMIEKARNVGTTESWPAIGMPSGVDLRNPGMSVWVFVVMGRIVGSDPIPMALACIAMNIGALVLLLGFALRSVPTPDREVWSWTAALLCVNPITVLQDRRIWAQSILPVFTMSMLIGWWNRSRWWGAASWGLLGAILGQIHMSGFYLAAALAGWTAISERRTPPLRRTHWKAWFGGSTLGALPLLPWLPYAAANIGGARSDWREVLQLRFLRHWFTNPLGTALDYFVGWNQFDPFFGDSVWPVRIALWAITAIGLIALAFGALHLWRHRTDRTAAGWLWGDGSSTMLLHNSMLFGMGALMTLQRMFIPRHYLLVGFAIPFFWLTAALLTRARLGRWLLIALWTLQLGVTVELMRQIHLQDGAQQGDYGITYSAQEVKGEGRVVEFW
jgi:hypothetical protein